MAGDVAVVAGDRRMRDVRSDRSRDFRRMLLCHTFLAMAVLAAGARGAHDGLLMLAVDAAHVRAGDVVGGEGDVATVAREDAADLALEAVGRAVRIRLIIPVTLQAVTKMRSGVKADVT